MRKTWETESDSWAALRHLKALVLRMECSTYLSTNRNLGTVSKTSSPNVTGQWEDNNGVVAWGRGKFNLVIFTLKLQFRLHITANTWLLVNVTFSPQTDSSVVLS